MFLVLVRQMSHVTSLGSGSLVSDVPRHVCTVRDSGFFGSFFINSELAGRMIQVYQLSVESGIL